ncbi:MAG: DUF4175 family protein, partial [Pirellulales bacterium]
VELAFPDLDATLLTAIEQRPAGGDGRYGFLQEGVLRQAFFHSYKNQWTELVPTRRLVLAHAANVASAGVLVAALVSLAAFSPTTPVATADESTAFASVAITRVYEAEIEPGSAEVERGSSLLVLARFKGELPPEATLIYQYDGQSKGNGEQGSDGNRDEIDERQVKMTQSLDDPVFGGRIAAIGRPLRYRVVFADRASQAFRVTVFDYPELVRADARLVFPSYTGLEEKLVQDVRRVSAVEGTRLTLACELNKPVAKAELIETADGEAPPIALAAVDGKPGTYAATMTLDRSRRFELRLVDEQGRANRAKAEFVVNVLPNRPPDLKLIAPAKDVEASPIEELDVRASAWDDFGLARVGLSYALGGKPPVDVVLGEGMPGKQHTPLDHTVSFEQLGAQPDELLSHYFWAEDMDAEGKPRRTASDMFFVEVRHFEEIFRQGQQPTDSQMAERQRQQQQQQQGGENARQAEELAELQKQIIGGTWKIIRRETSLPPSEAFASDVALLVESQESALEQAEALGERVEDEQSQSHLDAVREQMTKAAAHLTSAKDGPSLESLPTALSAEQAAYQGLLKLRAREHEVIRAQRQQQSQQQQQQQNQSARNNPSSRAQEQLQQLELREDENRYETQQNAQPQETAEQREDRQVLNRLRELSRRQEGLNERIKELQSSLEAAETPQEKEEIERQLKRLRDEQQQIVRDAEELQERMERPENQQRMTEERQQLEQARQNARQSSEALREGMVSQAAAEGERAEQELNQLRDQFQERTSGQFANDVRQMRDAARELDEREQALAERLAQLDQQQADSQRLDDGDERPQIAEELRKQQERLGELLERMRQTVEEAETAQPLLAEKLYDSIRENRRQDPARALSSAERSLDRGLIDDARGEEQQARGGISRLREDVDRAAESVLGNDAEVLQRALEELRALNEQLEGELQREGAQPGEQRSTRSENERQADQRNAQQQGERQGEQPGEQPGQPRDGQRGQPGEQPQNGQPTGDERRGQQQNDRQPGQRGQTSPRQNGEQPQDGNRQGGEQQQGERRQGEGQPGERQSNGQPRDGEQQNADASPPENPPDERNAPDGQSQPG